MVILQSFMNKKGDIVLILKTWQYKYVMRHLQKTPSMSHDIVLGSLIGLWFKY